MRAAPFRNLDRRIASNISACCSQGLCPRQNKQVGKRAAPQSFLAIGRYRITTLYCKTHQCSQKAHVAAIITAVQTILSTHMEHTHWIGFSIICLAYEPQASLLSHFSGRLPHKNFIQRLSSEYHPSYQHSLFLVLFGC